MHLMLHRGSKVITYNDNCVWEERVKVMEYPAVMFDKLTFCCQVNEVLISN